MTFKKSVIAVCFAFIALCTQAATLDEQLDLAESYDKQAIQYFQQRQFQKALPMAREAFIIRAEILGKHPYTLASLNNLAAIYQKLGRFEKALPLLETGYAVMKELAGEKHDKTLMVLGNLAVIYRELGRLDEALPLFETSYRLTKEVLGQKHPETLKSMNNLGTVYMALDRLSDALPLLEKAYRLTRAVLDEKHPDALRRLNNLARIYQMLGRLKEALPLFKKAFALRKEGLGEKHPSTLKSLNNLAGIYRDLGRLKAALPLYEKGYGLSKVLLGEKHSDTLTSLHNLAGIYKYLGRLNEALPLFEKSYLLTQDVFEEKHPDTLSSLNGLALIYQALGRLDEALLLFEKNYQLSKALLGEKHTTTVSNLNNLALCYQDLGRFDDALPLLEKSYRLSKAVLGEKHPETLISLHNLTVVHTQLGRVDDFIQTLSEKSYRLNREVLGEKHPETLTSLGNLALFYQDVGRLKKALPFSQKSYRLSKAVLGEKHPKTLISLNNLALNYQQLGRLDDALPLAEKAYRLNQDILGDKHPETLISLRNVAVDYALQNEIQKSVQHFEKFKVGVESLRRGDLSAENRQALFQQWVEGYFELSYLYIKRIRPFDAFRLAEMSKARTLLESLTHKRAAQHGGLSAEDQEQLQDYEARLALFNNRIAKALDEKRYDEKMRLETEKNQVVSQFNQFHSALMAKYPKYAQLSEVKIVEAKAGAQYLPTDAVLISYFVNGNNVLAFTLQSDGQLTAHNLGQISDLTDDVADYRRQLSLFGAVKGKPISVEKDSEPVKGRQIDLSDKPQKDRLTLSRELGMHLLAPLKEIIGDKRRWIISPDGPLALIPFETLRFVGEDAAVIAAHDISYVQSLSVLKLLQERGKAYQAITNRGTLLAMGAPLYHAPPAVTQQPSQVDFNIARHLVLRDSDPQSYERAFRQLNLHWKNLPGAKKELERLEKLFFFKTHRLRIYKEAEATEANLQRLNQFGILAKYRYLLFSAHGYLSTDVPALSAIVLGQVDNPAGIDGYVTAGEWPGYDLKSDLMVLSACETGVGKVVSGEGVMGLPYAFYVAGNKNTLLTLWAVSDEVTAEFIVSFFKKLKAGQGQIEGLTATKREFIKKGGRYSNPVYWAAFLLYGV